MHAAAAPTKHAELGSGEQLATVSMLSAVASCCVAAVAATGQQAGEHGDVSPLSGEVALDVRVRARPVAPSTLVIAFTAPPLPMQAVETSGVSATTSAPVSAISGSVDSCDK